jgi:DNA-binding transcriptional regulator LsrR (DeoR family)
MDIHFYRYKNLHHQGALTGLPALIPIDLASLVPEARSYSAKMRRELHRMLRGFFEVSSTAFREIFVDVNALVNDIDVLLTSVGTADRPMGFCNADLLRFGDLDQAALKRLVVGDVGGVLLPQRELTRREAAKVERLNAMWTGIQGRHFVTIARRAQAQNLPGVILIAMGASRSTIVREAVAEGWCSELIIDHDLAAALRTELKGGIRSTPSSGTRRRAK